MRKYKNIKTNNIAEQIGNKNSYYIRDLGLHFPKIFIEDSNDWVEITKPEYTILSYQRTKGEFLYDLLPNGKYKLRHHKTEFSASYFDNNEDIHSVRRESDGQVFTVGDIINGAVAKNIDIIAFLLYNNHQKIEVNTSKGMILLSDISKIQPKEWEITAYKVTGNEHWEVRKNLNGMWGGGSEQHKDAEVLKGNWKIKAIKRLSDNVEFKVGDKICGTQSINENKIFGPEYVIIKSFSINEQGFLEIDHCTGTNGDQYGGFAKLKLFVTEKLFTTEDGVDLYDVSDYKKLYGVALQAARTDVLLHGYNIGVGEYIIPSKNRKWFFSKEKAEEYILMNKPCLSINDISTIYPSAIDSKRKNGNGFYMEQLKELVNSKQSEIK